MRRIGVLLALLAIAGCSKEMGRAPFAGEGTQSTSVTLKAGDVDFWTDIDLSYEGSGTLAYDVTLAQGGKTVATASCDPLAPLNVRTMWTETNVGSSHTRHGMGKMACSVTLPSGGATDVRATLVWRAKPTTASMKKADLVIKQ